MSVSFVTWGSPYEPGVERPREMEGRLPPDDDDLFEWTDAPARPPRPSREAGAGERERPDTGERERPGTGERDRIEEPLAATGERGAVRDRRFGRGRTGDTEERRRIRGDTGEFERGGGRPPPGRRARRRDLPARVRRRQDLMVGAAVAAVIILLIVAISSGGGGSSQPAVGLKRLVGQTIVAKLSAKGPDPALIKRVRQGPGGGRIVFNKDAQKLQSDIRTLQQAASAGP